MGSRRVLKLVREKEKSKDESMIDLFGKKARITVQTIGIRVIITASRSVNSKITFTLDFFTAVPLLIRGPFSSF